MVVADRLKGSALPLLLTMFWIGGVPFFLLFGNRLLGSVLFLHADRVAFLLAAAPLALATLRGARTLRPLTGVEKAMAAYLAVIFASWATTLPYKGLTVFKQDADFILTCFIMPYTAFVIARHTAWSRERITTCLWVLVAGVGGYLLIFGTVQYAYDWNFLSERSRGPFENGGVYGIVVSLLIVLTLFLYLQSRARPARALLLMIAIGLVQCVVASKTRAVWIGLPLALLLVALRYPRIRAVAALSTAWLLGQLLLAPTVGVDRLGLEQRLVQVEPIHDRVALTATASSMIGHRPLFGYGFGMFTFQGDKGDFYTSWGGVSAQSAVYPNNPHNDALNVLILTGVVGFIPYLALLWTSWRLLGRNRVRWRFSSPFVAQLAGFTQAAFLVLLVAGQFHSVMYMSYPQVLFFFLLGIVASDAALTVRAADAPDVVAAPAWMAPSETATVAAGAEA